MNSVSVTCEESLVTGARHEGCNGERYYLGQWRVNHGGITERIKGYLGPENFVEMLIKEQI